MVQSCLVIHSNWGALAIFHTKILIIPLITALLNAEKSLLGQNLLEKSVHWSKSSFNKTFPRALALLDIFMAAIVAPNMETHSAFLGIYDYLVAESTYKVAINSIWLSSHLEAHEVWWTKFWAIVKRGHCGEGLPHVISVRLLLIVGPVGSVTPKIHWLKLTYPTAEAIFASVTISLTRAVIYFWIGYAHLKYL